MHYILMLGLIEFLYRSSLPNYKITDTNEAQNKLVIALNRLKGKVPNLQSVVNGYSIRDIISNDTRIMIDDINTTLNEKQNAIIKNSISSTQPKLLSNFLQPLIDKNIEMSKVIRRGGKRKRRVKKSLKKKKRSNKRKTKRK